MSGALHEPPVKTLICLSSRGKRLYFVNVAKNKEHDFRRRVFDGLWLAGTNTLHIVCVQRGQCPQTISRQAGKLVLQPIWLSQTLPQLGSRLGLDGLACSLESRNSAFAGPQRSLPSMRSCSHLASHLPVAQATSGTALSQRPVRNMMGSLFAFASHSCSFSARVGLPAACVQVPFIAQTPCSNAASKQSTLGKPLALG